MEGRQLADWRANLRDAIGGDDDNHPPVRTTHQHWHYHGEDSGVRGLDSEGGHVHQHDHGKKPDTQAPPEPDNTHVHVHDDADYGPGGDTPDPEERPDGQPGVSGRLGAPVLNMARRPARQMTRRPARPMTAAQRARVNEAFARAAAMRRP